MKTLGYRPMRVFLRSFVLLGILFLGCAADEATETTFPALSPQELTELIDAGTDMLILDVRSQEEYDEGHLVGSVHIPHTELSDRLGEIIDYRETPVIVYCMLGGRAGRAEAVLEEAGFTDLYDLTGHMRVWLSLGLPLDSNVTN